MFVTAVTVVARRWEKIQTKNISTISTILGVPPLFSIFDPVGPQFNISDHHIRNINGKLRRQCVKCVHILFSAFVLSTKNVVRVGTPRNVYYMVKSLHSKPEMFACFGKIRIFVPCSAIFMYT